LKILKDINLTIKYSRYYFGLSFLLFLIFGNSVLGSVIQRIIVSFVVLVGYIIFFNFISVLLKTQRKVNKHNWDKTKKALKFQLNFFIYFFTFGIFIGIFGGIMNIKSLASILFFINIPLGVVLGSIEAKQTYLSE